MRLLLNGGGAGKQTVLATRKLNEIIDHTKPLLYIPLAMEFEKYPSCKEWIHKELKDVNIPYIEMVTSADELAQKDLYKYSAIFIGGGNTYKLLHDLKMSGSFEKIKEYIENDGIIFGGSAGTIIFGSNLDSCACDDNNEIGLIDTRGFDLLNGVSILCHYGNRDNEKQKSNTEFLMKLSLDGRKIIALPEEDTLFINGDTVQIIGDREYSVFENGVLEKRNDKKFLKVMFGQTSAADRSFEYKVGEVNVANTWNPDASDPKDMGGFNFSVEDKIIRWLFRGDTIYDVEIPFDAELVDVPHPSTPHGVFRANKIIISVPRRVTDEMAMEFYQKSTIPEKSYFKAMVGCAIRGYMNTALQILEDKVNNENVDIALAEFRNFCTNPNTGIFNESELGTNTRKIYEELLKIESLKVGEE